MVLISQTWRITWRNVWRLDQPLAEVQLWVLKKYLAVDAVWILTFKQKQTRSGAAFVAEIQTQPVGWSQQIARGLNKVSH